MLIGKSEGPTDFRKNPRQVWYSKLQDVTTSAVGFVSRSSGQLRAVLGTCTHQGCLLALNQAAGRLECPCHGVWFTPSGEVLNQKLPQVLPSLPRLPVRERDGRAEVYLPPQT